MCAINRYTHTSYRSTKFGMMHDAASFVLHFHLLFGITAFEKGIDLRKHIEGDGMRIHFRPRRLTFGKGADLLLQLSDRTSAAARDGLITGSENALHIENAMARIKCH